MAAFSDINKPLANCHILLVEDSSDIRLIHKKLFSLYGATVEEAENGQDGVNKALARPHDIIIMDLNMPVLDGYEATKLIRSHGIMDPIMALTSSHSSKVSAICLEMGFNACYSKLTDYQSLVNYIIELSKKSLRHA